MTRYAVTSCAGIAFGLLTALVGLSTVGFGTVGLNRVGTSAITGVELAVAQTGGGLDLVSQTAFVGDEPATIELRLSAPTDARIRIQIHEALTTREEIHASYNGVTGQPFSDFRCNVDQPSADGPCAVDRTEETYTIEIPDEEIGEILRINQGALPVVITLEDESGNPLDTLTTYLLVLEERAQEEQTEPALHLAFLADLAVPIAIQPDQTISIDPDDLIVRAREIAERDDVPVTVAIQPETLQALATNHREQLAELAELLSGRPILNAPWVELDEEGWRLAGGTALIAEQYRYGSDTIAETLGRRPTNISKLDGSAGAETLALLRSLGTESVIVQTTQVTRDTDAPDEFAPLALRDSNGETTHALVPDTVLRRAFSHVDAELAGHRALVELAIEANNAIGDQTILFMLDELRPAELDVLTDGFKQRRNLRLSALSDAVGVPAARNRSGQLIQASLDPTPAPEVAQRSFDIAAAQGTLDAYASMITPARAPVTALETLLLAAAAGSLSDEQSAAYTHSVFEAVLGGTAHITVEPAERITLTDRQANLPITIHNGQPLPITVDLLFSAEKLRFIDGERFTRTLAPGDNEIAVRVETLSSGDALVTVAITSPGGQLELHEGVVDIRSTAISGLGLVISVIAVGVLGGWWIRTIRRVRRNRAAATVASALAATVSTDAQPEQATQPQQNQDEP